MKSVTIREFNRDATLVEQLPAGGQIIVTAKGKPKFVVTKGERPRMTATLAEKRSVGTESKAEFNGVTFLRALKE